MKIFYLILGCAMLGLLLQNCKSEDSPEDPTTETIAKLSGNWSVDNASIDSENVTSDFSSFNLSITNTLNYTTNSSSISRSPNPWPQDGSFSFGGSTSSPNLNRLIRDDGLNISIVLSESGDELMMTFNFSSENTDSSEGRLSAINGEWMFTFVK